FDAYLGILRQCDSFLPIVRQMLGAANPRLRDLGRDALLPVLAERLRTGPITAETIWHALEETCPGAAMIDERLRLCALLPDFGIDTAAAVACAVRLQDERLVPCMVCEAQVRSKDIESHL